MSSTIFDLSIASSAINKNGYERLIIKEAEGNVLYSVVKHKRTSLIGKEFIIKRKSFVDWLYGITLKKEKFAKGDIIDVKGNKFLVLSNNGAFGKIKSLNTNQILKEFYWSGYGDCKTIKIGRQSSR